MKTVLIGANGQLGTAIQTLYPETISLSHKDIDIIDRNTFKVIGKPDVIINAAAYNEVDEAEDRPEHAYDINAIGVFNLAKYCKEVGATLVHISTDYVFGGDTERTVPYEESDTPYPVNAYGISKLSGELFVQYTLEKYFIIRTTGLFGKSNSSKVNFVDRMLSLKNEKEIRVVNDQTVSPTYTKDLAKQIMQIIETENYGLYHAVSNDSCTWYEFAKEILGDPKNLIPVTSEEFHAKARRVSYSVLSTDKLTRLGINCMRSWKEGLKDYLHEL